MVYSHDSFIANSKTFSIVITIINSKTFSDSVAWFYIDCESFDDGGFNSFEDGVISYDFNIIVIEV